MRDKKLSQIEAMIFTVYLKLKEIRKEVELVEKQKAQRRAKLVLIKGGKVD